MTTTISPSLTLYLNDIGNHELLSKADEVNFRDVKCRERKMKPAITESPAIATSGENREESAS